MSDLTRRTNFTGDPLIQVHDDEIKDIIDQVNRNSDALNQQTTSTTIAYSATFSALSTDWFGVAGAYLNKNYVHAFTHGLGYYPVTLGYVLYSGQMYALPLTIIDSAGVVQLAAYLYPTDASNSVTAAEVFVQAHNITPQLTFYVYCLTVPSGVTQSGV